MNARRIKHLRRSSMRRDTCGTKWRRGFSCGISRNSILSGTGTRTSKAAWTFCCGGRKNRGPGMKISPKVKQIVLVLFLLAAAAAQAEGLRLEKSADAMGSTYSIALYGDDRIRMEAAADAAFDEVHRLDAQLSNYKPDSEWSEVNLHAAEAPVKVSPDLFQLFSACQEYSGESDGAF